MEKINFQNGTLISKAKVTIDNAVYEVEPEEYEGTTPLSAEVLNQMQDNIENAIEEKQANIEEQGRILTEKIIGTVLYEDKEGTTETVTLNDSVANYDYIEIFFRTSTNYKSVKIYEPNNKGSILDFVDFINTEGSNFLYFYTKKVQIVNNSISRTRYKTYRFKDSTTWSPHGSDTDSINITRVVGYKY